MNDLQNTEADKGTGNSTGALDGKKTETIDIHVTRPDGGEISIQVPLNGAASSPSDPLGNFMKTSGVKVKAEAETEAAEEPGDDKGKGPFDSAGNDSDRKTGMGDKKNLKDTTDISGEAGTVKASEMAQEISAQTPLTSKLQKAELEGPVANRNQVEARGAAA